METATAPTMARRPALPPHHRHKKHRWEYTGVLSKTPSKTTPVRTRPDNSGIAYAPAPLEPPLVESFLSDASMATSHSHTTATSSQDPQTPTTPRGPIPPLLAPPAVVVRRSALPSAPTTTRVPIDSDALARIGRVAKKRVETLAHRDALVGSWRKRLLAFSDPAPTFSSSSSSSLSPLSGRRRRRAESERVECQVLDFRSPRRDEYKILARMNIAGSLREIMHVLSTDNAAHFHRSMAALFGAQYITGENEFTNESVGPRRSQSTSSRLSKVLLLAARRSSMRPTSASVSPRRSSASTGVSNIKMALNSVTLQLRHGFLRRRLHDWQFVDYLDENVDAMAVTRVLQTVRPTTHRSGASKALANKARPSLGDVLAGYVIREDPEAQFTRVFFYGEARTDKKRVATHVKKLLRSMVETLCRLVATVERQRLSALFRLHRASESVPVAASRCFACNTSFTLSSRRHTCACCRQSVCRKCLEHREIETAGTGDGTAATRALTICPPAVERVRVCRGCVDRVSLPTLEASNGKRKSSDRGGPNREVEEDDEDDDDDDDVIVVDAFSEDGSYDWE